MSRHKKSPTPGCATCPNDPPHLVCMHAKGIGHKGCPTLTQKDLLARANRGIREAGNSNICSPSLYSGSLMLCKPP